MVDTNTSTEKQEKNDKPSDKKSKPPRRNLDIIEQELCDLIEGFPPKLLKAQGAFPYRFEVVRARRTDAPIILELKDNTAEIVDYDTVASALRRYVQLLRGKQLRYNLRKKICREIAQAWSTLHIHRTELPKAVGFKSDEQLVLHRLPYDPILNCCEDDLRKYAPLFVNYLDRMTNAEAFCARVGSIFDYRAHRKQAAWVQGEKDSGKSSLSMMLTMLVGSSWASLSGRALEEKFWKESIVGKRLMIVNETLPKFLRTEEFKNLTGDRNHMIRPFGAKPYQAILEPIAFFFSNHSPDVPNQEEVIDRVIHCILAKLSDAQRLGEFDVIDRFVAELPFIAGFCMAKWAEVPQGREIPVDRSSLVTVVENYEGKYLDFIANYLDIGENYIAESGDVNKLMIHEGMRSSGEQNICKRVILAQPGIRTTRTTPPGATKRVDCYLGLRIKQEHKPIIEGMKRRLSSFYP